MTLSISWDDTLRQQLKARLLDFPRQIDTDPQHRRAAVAILVVEEGSGADLAGIPNPTDWSTQAALVLTRRSAALRNHPGQWAFPGGRLDEGETLEQAALRELSEEVDMHLAGDHVLGCLDDFVTRSGFAITPVVVWGAAQLQGTPNPGEVASIHRIPLTEFLRPDAPRLDNTHTSEHPVLRMPVGDDSIAAPTAALIYQFAEVCLRGRQTRVAHFEQPEFAWR